MEGGKVGEGRGRAVAGRKDARSGREGRGGEGGEEN